MPKLGSAGPETYKQATTPSAQAVVGDYWDNGIQVRILTAHRGWINVAGPAVEADA